MTGRDFSSEPNGPTPWWAPGLVFLAMLALAVLAGAAVGLVPGFR